MFKVSLSHEIKSFNRFYWCCEYIKSPKWGLERNHLLSSSFLPSIKNTVWRGFFETTTRSYNLWRNVHSHTHTHSATFFFNSHKALCVSNSARWRDSSSTKKERNPVNTPLFPQDVNAALITPHSWAWSRLKREELFVCACVCLCACCVRVSVCVLPGRMRWAACSLCSHCFRLHLLLLLLLLHHLLSLPLSICPVRECWPPWPDPLLPTVPSSPLPLSVFVSDGRSPPPTAPAVRWVHVAGMKTPFSRLTGLCVAPSLNACVCFKSPRGAVGSGRVC